MTQPRSTDSTHSTANTLRWLFLTENGVFYQPNQFISDDVRPGHIISHITDFALQKNHLHSHKRGIAHVICKSQIVAPDANRCTEAKCQRALAKASIRL